MRFLIILLATILYGTPTFALTTIRFSLDWKFEGPSAPYFVALDKGYFEAEGMDVTIDTGQGSLEAIPRVTGGHTNLVLLTSIHSSNSETKIQPLISKEF